MNKELKENRKNKRIELVFLLWFITLPFGSFIGGISIGFMTLYPSLIIGFVLFTLVIPSIKKWKRSIQLFFLLLLIWFLYAVSWSLWNSTNEDWKFDVKSLFLQLVYSGILFGSYYKLGVNHFKSLLLKGVSFFLGILIVVGVIEYHTEIHLLSSYSYSHLVQEVTTDILNAPVFIYGNPNNYLVYFFGLTALYFSLLGKKSKSPWKLLTILLLGFIFSSAADARIFMFVCVVLIFIQLLQLYKETGGISMNSNAGRIILGTGLIFTLIIFQPLFIGPKYAKFSKTTKKEFTLSSKSKSNKDKSLDTRISLFKNGVDLIKENPILGVGPGQYRWSHRTKKVEHDTGTFIGPHNYVIELISQYGIISWIYLFFIIYAFFLQFKKVNRRKGNLWLLLLFLVFGLMSLVPAGFLYLDINWLIVPILMLFSYELLNSEESIHE